MKTLRKSIEVIIMSSLVSSDSKYLDNATDQILSLFQERVGECVGEKREEGHTKQCKDVLQMNYLIGRNKGWNEKHQEILEKFNQLFK